MQLSPGDSFRWRTPGVSGETPPLSSAALSPCCRPDLALRLTALLTHKGSQTTGLTDSSSGSSSSSSSSSHANTIHISASSCFKHYKMHTSCILLDISD